MHSKFELFSDYFALRDNAVNRVDARVKVILAVAVLLAVLLSQRVGMPLAVAAACFAAGLALRVPARVWLLRLAAPLAIAAVICVLRPFFVDGEPVWVLRIGGWELAATREGIRDGVQIGCRVLGAVSAMILLSMTTPAYRIFAVLRWMRLPRTLVETAMLMYRYIFDLLGHAADAVSAARVRLGFSSGRRALSTMGMVAGAVLVRAIDQTERTHEAMKARGYDGRLPMARLEPLTGGTAVGLLGGLAAVACVYLLMEGHLL